MAKVVTAETFRIEVIGRARESKHQPGSYYYPTLFQHEGIEGEDGKLWKNLSGEEITQIQRGDRVQLVEVGRDKHGNLKHNILLLSSAPAPQAIHPARDQAATRKQAESVDSRREKIRRYVSSMTALYSECYQQARAELEPLGASEESIKCCASSVFIATQRKFDLV